MTAIIPCPVCDRPTRHYRTTPLDYPGTAQRAMADGTCRPCYNAWLRAHPNQKTRGANKTKPEITPHPEPPLRSIRRPTRNETVTLCRWFGRRALLVTGLFVKITPDYYALRIEGEEIDFDRFHWEEVIEHD